MPLYRPRTPSIDLPGMVPRSRRPFPEVRGPRRGSDSSVEGSEDESMVVLQMALPPGSDIPLAIPVAAGAVPVMPGAVAGVAVAAAPVMPAVGAGVPGVVVPAVPVMPVVPVVPMVPAGVAGIPGAVAPVGPVVAPVPVVLPRGRWEESARGVQVVTGVLALGFGGISGGLTAVWTSTEVQGDGSSEDRTVEDNRASRHSLVRAAIGTGGACAFLTGVYCASRWAANRLERIRLAGGPAW